MAADLSSMPGTRIRFTQPIEMRMNEPVAGARSDLAVGLFGRVVLPVLLARAGDRSRSAGTAGAAGASAPSGVSGG
jgi:Cu/Ag efflux pump CusA